MSGTPATGQPGDQRMLTFRSGGWILALALVLISLIIGWRMLVIVREHTGKVAGDGANVDTYQFDLTTLLIPRDTFVASGMPKNGLRPIDDPAIFTGEAAEAYNKDHRGKYLVPSDRVIGVSFNGVARAYPVRVLNWHEIINDTVGGRPIAVTYSPLCDSAVVFDRALDGETLSFGFSGLLYNSNLLMYDRRPDDKGESLWSQLQFRAVAGPAAAKNQALRILPCAVLRWDDWKALHPDSGVLAPDPMYVDRYRRDPYANYYGTPGQLRFPVEPLPPKEGEPAWKTPVVAVRVADAWHVIPLPAIAEHAGSGRDWNVSLDGTDLRFTGRDDPPTASVSLPDGHTPDEVVYAFWFAWYSMHPDAAKELLPAAEAK